MAGSTNQMREAFPGHINTLPLSLYIGIIRRYTYLKQPYRFLRQALETSSRCVTTSALQRKSGASKKSRKIQEKPLGGLQRCFCGNGSDSLPFTAHAQLKCQPRLRNVRQKWEAWNCALVTHLTVRKHGAPRLRVQRRH